jgi:parallel beta helix pectate lyase-like protein
MISRGFSLLPSRRFAFLLRILIIHYLNCRFFLPMLLLENVTTPISLPAGNYWLAYLPSSSSLGFKVLNGSGTTRYYSFGSKTVTPTQATTYTLVAQGQGGPKSATVTVKPSSGFWERKTCPAPPQTDVVLSPGTNIQAAIDAHAQGTSFLLKAGVYQNQSISLKAGDKIYGELGAGCKPLTILNGGRTLTSFQQQGALYYASGQTQRGQRILASGDPGGRTCLPGYPRCNYPEDVFIDDVSLRHVGTLAEVAPGKYFFDYAADRIYIADNPVGHKVDTTITPQAIAAASDVVIRGLVIEKYATPHSVIDIDQKNNVTVEFNEIRLNHGFGVSWWQPQGGRIANNFIHHNGRGSYSGGEAANVTIDGNELSYNNYLHWDMWDGGKFWRSNGMVSRGNCIHNNYGTAIWSDTINTNLTYESNLIFDNIVYRDATAAIYDYGAIGNTIRYNVIGRNTWENNDSSAPATEDTNKGAGVGIQGSSAIDIYNNYVEVAQANANGITVNTYSVGSAGPQVISGNRVHNNEITFLGTDGRSGVNGAISGTVFDNNRYHVTNVNAGDFQWGWPAITFAQLQAAGAEQHSTIDTNVTPLNWSCDMAIPAIAVSP